jgi:hypothetical protein
MDALAARLVGRTSHAVSGDGALLRDLVVSNSVTG